MLGTSEAPGSPTWVLKLAESTGEIVVAEVVPVAVLVLVTGASAVHVETATLLASVVPVATPGATWTWRIIEVLPPGEPPSQPLGIAMP